MNSRPWRRKVTLRATTSETLSLDFISSIKLDGIFILAERSIKYIFLCLSLDPPYGCTLCYSILGRQETIA